VRAEVEQHRLLDPPVRHPGAVDLLGDPQRAAVQRGDDLVEGAGEGRLHVRGSDFSTSLERVVDQRLGTGHQRQISTMRRAASTQSDFGGTSAMRT
jgi:hypothetical protein